jgi:hypothetical protein
MRSAAPDYRHEPTARCRGSETIIYMGTLRNEQVERLTPEQQKLLAPLVLRRVQKRERLLNQAKQSEVHLCVQGGVLVATLGVAFYGRLATPLLLYIGDRWIGGGCMFGGYFNASTD